MILAYAYHFRFLLRQPDLHCNIHNFFHTVGSYGYSFHVCATDVPTGNAVANWYSGVSFVRSAYISWCNSIRTPGAFAPGGSDVDVYTTKGIRFHEPNRIRFVHLNEVLWIQNPDIQIQDHAR